MMQPKLRRCIWMATAAATLLSSAAHNATKVSAQEVSPDDNNRNLFYEGYMANPDLNCRLDQSHADESVPPEQATFDFVYYYALGSNDIISDTEMIILEQAMFEAVQARIVWCYENGNDNARKLVAVPPPPTTVSLSDVRKLGVVLVSMNGMDVDSKFGCPANLRTLIENTNSTNCTVKRGVMRIVAHTTDSVAYMQAALRQGLKDAMMTDAVYSYKVPHVLFLKYLGNTEEEVIENGGVVTNEGDVEGLAGGDNDDATTDDLTSVRGDPPSDHPSLAPSTAPIFATTTTAPTKSPTLSQIRATPQPASSSGAVATLHPTESPTAAIPTTLPTPSTAPILATTTTAPTKIPTLTLIRATPQPASPSGAVATLHPTESPATAIPTALPIKITGRPTKLVTSTPVPSTASPTTGAPTAAPTPTKVLDTTEQPAFIATFAPTLLVIDRDVATALPTLAPAMGSTVEEGGDGAGIVTTELPSSSITVQSDSPSDAPSNASSDAPSVTPNDTPGSVPSDAPSMMPSDTPSMMPSDTPSMMPSDMPSMMPSDTPSTVPSDLPSTLPSDLPSSLPSDLPSTMPSDLPSTLPSDMPSDAPSGMPHDGAFVGGGGVLVGGGDGSSDGADGAGGVTTVIRTTENDDDDDTVVLIALAVGVPVVLGLLVLAMFANKRQHNTMTIAKYEEMMKNEFVLVGTGDPPKSYHEGLYHYKADGVRYLSTRCEQCLETRKNMFYTDNFLGTIQEHEIYNDEQGFASTLSPRNLGVRPLSIDVHRCSSATCDRCNGAHETQTTFVPSPKLWKMALAGDDGPTRVEEAATAAANAAAGLSDTDDDLESRSDSSHSTGRGSYEMSVAAPDDVADSASGTQFTFEQAEV